MQIDKIDGIVWAYFSCIFEKNPGAKRLSCPRVYEGQALRR
jgi:hypothetical protein